MCYVFDFGGHVRFHCTFSALEADAYENSSGGVIEMLDMMSDKLFEERFQLERVEMNTRGPWLSARLRRLLTRSCSEVLKKGLTS